MHQVRIVAYELALPEGCIIGFDPPPRAALACVRLPRSQPLLDVDNVRGYALVVNAMRGHQ